MQLTQLSLHSLDCFGQQLTYFPFEEHICEIRFNPSSSQFKIKTLKADLPDQHTEHFIVKKARLIPLQTESNGEIITRAMLKIHLKRLVGFYVVAIFLPSILLLFINSLALWIIEPHSARLLISLFVTISLVMQWIIIVCNAPSSSTIRAIDVWMIFAVMHSLIHIAVHITILAVYVEEKDERRSSRTFSSLSSRPLSRLRQVKPLEVTNLYDALLAKMAQEENKDTWTIAYWIMFSTKVVSPTLTLLFMVTYWPFVVFYTEKNL